MDNFGLLQIYSTENLNLTQLRYMIYKKCNLIKYIKNILNINSNTILI
jgi:hypothetical protein